MASRKTNQPDKQNHKQLSGQYQEPTPQRVDRFLSAQIPELSRREVQHYIKSDFLKINKAIQSAPSAKLQPGDEYEFFYQIHDPLKPDYSGKVQVHYQDNDLLVIEKPAGLPVYLTAKFSKRPSVVNLLLAEYPKLRGVGEPERPGIVHRLDKQTSGLLVVARTESAYTYLKKLFLERKIEKWYQALVFGRAEKTGVIEKPLTKIGQQGQSRVRVDDSGKNAKTEYEVLAYYKEKNASAERLARSRVDEYSLLRVKLHTGRTHQIRVHFFSENHPVMGDSLYGKPDSQRLYPELRRQFLHASQLKFTAPSGKKLELSSPLPADLQTVLDELLKVNS